MKKPDSMRQAISDGLDVLKKNPDTLHLFVDEGLVVSTGVPAPGWEYRYTLNVVVTDYAGDPNLLIAVVCDWLTIHQPDAMNNAELREKLFRFEVDILNNGLCDIALYLALTERVIVTVDNGVATVEAVPEPQNPEDNYWIRHG